MNPEAIIAETTIGTYNYIMVGLSIFVAFILMVLFAKNLPDIGSNWIIGIFIKAKKMHRVGQIFIYKGTDWYLSDIGSINLTFKKVMSRVEHGVTLEEKHTLTKQYSKFIKDDIEKTGEYY